MCFLYKSKEFGIEGNGISLGTKKPPPISCAYLTSWKAQYMINSQKKKKGKDPKGLLDISQAKHVWVSDLKWFSLQLGHAWHTQQGELVVPLRSEDRWQGSWAIGGVSESPLYSDLKLFGEKFCIQLQPPAVDCFGHCLIFMFLYGIWKEVPDGLPMDYTTAFTNHIRFLFSTSWVSVTWVS